MKKIILILMMFVMFTSCSCSREHVKMIRSESDMFFVNATINDELTMPFIFDSGCGECNIPVDFFYYLVKQGSVKKEDMLPARTYIIADGSEITCYRFKIKTLKIGTVTLKDISASISQNENAPFLLGQNVMSKFKKITIDYKTNELILE